MMEMQQISFSKNINDGKAKVITKGLKSEINFDNKLFNKIPQKKSECIYLPDISKKIQKEKSVSIATEINDLKQPIEIIPIVEIENHKSIKNQKLEKKVIEQDEFVYHDNGSIKKIKGDVETRIYHDNGQLKKFAVKLEGKLHGEEWFYFKNGNLREVTSYFEGDKDGVHKKWYPSGQLKEIVYWENNLREGQNIIYYDTGFIKSVENYELGKLHGDAKWWHDNGDLSSLITWEKGKKNGSEIHYYKNGNRKWEALWVKGAVDEPAVKYDEEGTPEFDLNRFYNYYLEKTQEQDGHWSCEKTGGMTGVDNDLVATSFAVLQYLEYGFSDRVGVHKYRVKRGLAWLLSQQKENGFFSDRIDHHAICLMVLGEALGMGCKVDKSKVEKAFEVLIELQNKDGLFPISKNKKSYPISTTYFSFLGLKSLMVSGIKEDEIKASFRVLGKTFSRLEKKYIDYENSFYTSLIHGEESQRNLSLLESKAIDPWLKDTEDSSFKGTVVSINCLLRQYLGYSRDELWMKKARNIIIEKMEDQDFTLDSFEMLSLVLPSFQFGKKIWSLWLKLFENKIINSQQRYGYEESSWNPGSYDYEKKYGKVLVTSQYKICLAVYFRYKSVMGSIK